MRLRGLQSCEYRYSRTRASSQWIIAPSISARSIIGDETELFSPCCACPHSTIAKVLRCWKLLCSALLRLEHMASSCPWLHWKEIYSRFFRYQWGQCCPPNELLTACGATGRRPRHGRGFKGWSHHCAVKSATRSSPGNPDTCSTSEATTAICAGVKNWHGRHAPPQRRQLPQIYCDKPLTCGGVSHWTVCRLPVWRPIAPGSVSGKSHCKRNVSTSNWDWAGTVNSSAS
jgi:hypothetical protein